MIRILDGTVRDISWVAGNMNADDRREVYAMVHQEKSAYIGHYSYFGSEECNFTAWMKVRRGDVLVPEPVCAWGASEVTPNVYSAWCFGTDNMRRAIPAVTRHIKQHVFPSLWFRGAQRVEIRSIADHESAHPWIEQLGAKRECVLKNFGKNGEDFILFAWTRDQFTGSEPELQAVRESYHETIGTLHQLAPEENKPIHQHRKRG